MGLNRNNNNHTIYRIAKNNLMAKKTSSFISMLSILLAVTLVATLTLFIIGPQTAKEQELNEMQHVTYLNVTEAQEQSLASDKKTETCISYKYFEKEFQVEDVKYSFYYFSGYGERIRTYVLSEGEAPEKYNEIVVDKAFMKALDKNCALGTTIALDIDGATEEFVICGYTDNKDSSVLTQPVIVSNEFAAKSSTMKDLPYTAFVRLNDVSDIPASAFTTAAYQMAMDYGVERSNVNINGKFEESLQVGNNGLYIIFFVSILLFIASGLVIYSIFFLSVTSRVQQIGQFQTIGMTGKQVKKMIRHEGLLLSVVAIPIGLLISGVVSYLLLPDGWTFKNYGIVALAVSLFGVLIVQISIRKPVSLASKISPIEASKNTCGDQKERPGDGKSKKLTPFTLARMENRNNRKRWWLTTVSLALGGIIFMVAVTWISSWDKEDFFRQNLFEEHEYHISYLYDHGSPKTYGTTDMQLTGHLGKDLEEDIRKIPHVKDIHIERDASGIIEHQGATFMQAFYPVTEEDTEYFQLPAEGNNSYEYMVKNDAILITSSTLSENMNGIKFKPGEKVTLRYFDGEEHTIELEIAAVSTEQITAGNRSNFCMSDATMNKLWKSMNTASSFSVSVSDYEKNGDQVEEEIRALINSYGDLSLGTLREQKIEYSAEMQERQLEIYGVSIFIILFSIFNLINTVISSIASRKKQLSMLESIGMEERQVRSMLLWESFLLAVPNIFITLTIGTAAGFAFISFMQETMSYLNYSFPLLPIILYCMGMAGIPMVISFCCLKRQNKISLVERIKDEK